MLKKLTYLFVLCFLSIGFLAFREKFFSSQPPSNYSGAPGGGICRDCHNSFALNSGGGGVTVNGLPSTFQPGQTYPFSITISHGTADRTRWGFEINARNAANTGIGTFASSNPNAALDGGPSEIAHFGAVFTAPSASYTYTNLSWTAPATINNGDNSVTFYIAGNAANGNGNNQGDYIYSNTAFITLPVQMQSLSCNIIEDYKVKIDWATASEKDSKEFIVEKSDDNTRFYEAGRVAALGSSSAGKAYSFIDDKPSYFNQPIYYRIKQVDLDGNASYSKIISVVLKGRSTYVYSLSPNPASDHFLVGISAEEANPAEAVVFSANGEIVYRTTLQLSKGRNSYTIPLKSLHHGSYFFRLTTLKGTQTISFVAM